MYNIYSKGKEKVADKETADGKIKKSLNIITKNDIIYIGKRKLSFRSLVGINEGLQKDQARENYGPRRKPYLTEI